jgi:hypothetical protein
MPRVASSRERRMSSAYQELPPSITMSSRPRWGSSELIVGSTAAAGTMSQIARGVSSLLHSSSIDAQPSACSFASDATASGERS